MSARQQSCAKRSQKGKDQMPEVHVALVHGVNEGVDPKLMPDGWMTRAENVRFRKDGRPGSRFGYDFITGSTLQALAAGNFGEAHSVYVVPRTSIFNNGGYLVRGSAGTFTTYGPAFSTTLGTVGPQRQIHDRVC